MLIFGNGARGCYHEMMNDYTVGRGAFLTLPGGDTFPNNGGTEPYFISGINLGQKEKYHIVQCFNDRNYTYAFGHDPQASTVEVTFTAFITNSAGEQFGDSLQTLVSAYKSNRLFEQPQYAVLTLGPFTLEGFVVGMSSGTADTEHNIQTFSFMIILVEAQHD
jgi:hypothetical protein